MKESFAALRCVGKWITPFDVRILAVVVLLLFLDGPKCLAQTGKLRRKLFAYHHFRLWRSCALSRTRKRSSMFQVGFWAESAFQNHAVVWRGNVILSFETRRRLNKSL